MRVGPVEVVEHGEQLADELRAGGDQHGLAVAVDPAPVVGVLRGDPLQVGGALGDLGGELGDTRVIGRTSSGPAGGGPAGRRPSPSGVRTSPVSGSIRRRSRITTRSPSSSARS